MTGLILYSIELNGCLNGVYTNDSGSMPEICTETAKRRTGTGDGDMLSGTYDCMFFEPTSTHKTILTIECVRDTFYFIWGDLTAPTFIGVGYIMNQTQAVVRYHDGT